MAFSLETLPSPALLARTRSLIQRGHALEAELLAHLGEVDARSLYLEEACSSMFDFCARVLHFAEPVAYKRIQAARAARRHPELLEAVRRGELHLTAVGLLAPQLTRESCAELIRAARHKKAEDIRRMLADRQPRPDGPSCVSRVSAQTVPSSFASARPEQRAASSAPPPAAEDPTRREAPREDARRTARSEPLGGERYAVRFTAGPELHAQLQELQARMRHQIPDGDVGKIIAKAIPLLLERERKRQLGECRAPRSAKPSSDRPSRHIPASIRRRVAQREEERCTWTSPSGRRCEARELLQYHHRDHWAGSRRHSIDGITLLCRAHNQIEARRDFGEAHMARFWKRDSDGASRPTPSSDGNSSQRDPNPVRRGASARPAPALEQLEL